jgi:ankyrin repeat protein
MKAAFRGDLPEVKRLVAKGAEVNAKANSGITALIAALKNGHPEVRELLIKAGAK